MVTFRRSLAVTMLKFDGFAEFQRPDRTDCKSEIQTKDALEWEPNFGG